MCVGGVWALIFSRLTRAILTVSECTYRSIVVCILKPFCTSRSSCCRRPMRRLFGWSDGHKLKASPDAGFVIHSRNSIIPFWALVLSARLQRTEKRPPFFRGLPTLQNNVLRSSCLTGGALKLVFFFFFSIFCNVKGSTVSVVAEVCGAAIECFIKTCPPGDVPAAGKQTWKWGLGRSNIPKNIVTRRFFKRSSSERHLCESDWNMLDMSGAAGKDFLLFIAGIGLVNTGSSIKHHALKFSLTAYEPLS